jgi:hypothetical protein
MVRRSASVAKPTPLATERRKNTMSLPPTKSLVHMVRMTKSRDRTAALTRRKPVLTVVQTTEKHAHMVAMVPKREKHAHMVLAVPKRERRAHMAVAVQKEERRAHMAAVIQKEENRAHMAVVIQKEGNHAHMAVVIQKEGNHAHMAVAIQKEGNRAHMAVAIQKEENHAHMAVAIQKEENHAHMDPTIKELDRMLIRTKESRVLTVHRKVAVGPTGQERNVLAPTVTVKKEKDVLEHMVRKKIARENMLLKMIAHPKQKESKAPQKNLSANANIAVLILLNKQEKEPMAKRKSER